jgi:hypothetical protein
MSCLLWILDPDGAKLNAALTISPEGREKIATYFPDKDKHRS